MSTSHSSKLTFNPLLILTLIFLVFGLIIGLLMISRPQIYRGKAAGVDARLVISASKNPLNPGDTFNVTVNLANPTPQDIIGVDVALNFDSSKLELTNVTPNTASGFAAYLPLITGTNNFDVQTVKNNANSSGVVQFGTATFNLSTQTLTSASRSLSTDLATLTFLVKPNTSGTIPLSIKYTANTTTDSNVVIANPAVQDILAAPTALNLTINPASTPTVRKPGDADNDGDVDLVDYNIWATNYKKVVAGGPNVGNFDNSTNNLIDLLDYNIWATNYKK